MRSFRRRPCAITCASRSAARPYEVFMGLFLDSQNRVLAAEELFRGTLAQTSVYPREVVKAALARNAAAMIFAHNHPSGVAEPSRADELLTQALKQALALVDIRTLDHFVVAGGTADVVRGARVALVPRTSLCGRPMVRLLLTSSCGSQEAGARIDGVRAVGRALDESIPLSSKRTCT